MDQKGLQEVLNSGREKTAKLLEQILPAENSPVQLLLKEILGSFSNALSALDATGQLAAAAAADSTKLKVEVTTSCSIEDKSKKRKMQTPRGNGHRRRSNTYTRKQLGTTTEDGFTWRKYGQKHIFGSNFPRSYFRCTHKHERHCHAQRQVQQSEEDPSLYVITYLGEHTCVQPHTASNSPGHKPSSTCIIDFAANKTASGESNYCDALQVEAAFDTAAAAADLPQPKHECDEEVLSSLTPGASSSSDPLAFDYLPEFEGPIPAAVNCGESILDQHDVQSSWGHLELDDDIFNWDQD